MAAGKHIGKVLIKLRSEEEQEVLVPVLKPIEAMPRYFCKEDCSYIITGNKALDMLNLFVNFCSAIQFKFFYKNHLSF